MSENAPITSEQEPLIPDDPTLGRFIANHPGKRLELLVTGAAVLIAVWLTVTILLWQVEETLAVSITVLILAITTLLVGWYISHLWNREVLVYERGFTYQRGSQIAYLHYADVVVIQQQGGRKLYFNGLIRRSTFRLTLITRLDEIITINSFYRDHDALTLRLENEITRLLLIDTRKKLSEGQRVSFGAGLEMDQSGLHTDADTLTWEHYSGYRLANQQIALLDAGGAEWRSFPLIALENLRLLVTLLNQRKDVQP